MRFKKRNKGKETENQCTHTHGPRLIEIHSGPIPKTTLNSI